MILLQGAMAAGLIIFPAIIIIAIVFILFFTVFIYGVLDSNNPNEPADNVSVSMLVKKRKKTNFGYLFCSFLLAIGVVIILAIAGIFLLSFTITDLD